MSRIWTQVNRFHHKKSNQPKFFLQFSHFLRKIYVWPLGDVNSSLDPGGRRQFPRRWGNTSRRHRSWLWGAWPCIAGHPRWRWRGRYLGATDLGSELGAKICGSDLGAVDLGSELGAMDPGAEHGFKTHGQVPLAEAAFMYNFWKYFAFQTGPWQCLQRVWIWSSESKVSNRPLTVLSVCLDLKFETQR